MIVSWAGWKEINQFGSVWAQYESINSLPLKCLYLKLEKLLKLTYLSIYIKPDLKNIFFNDKMKFLVFKTQYDYLIPNVHHVLLNFSIH